jgi:ATPase subunit of ABC transporter with duplicated ATPase domains
MADEKAAEVRQKEEREEMRAEKKRKKADEEERKWAAKEEKRAGKKVCRGKTGESVSGERDLQKGKNGDDDGERADMSNAEKENCDPNITPVVLVPPPPSQPVSPPNCYLSTYVCSSY